MTTPYSSDSCWPINFAEAWWYDSSAQAWTHIPENYREYFTVADLYKKYPYWLHEETIFNPIG